MKKMNSNIVHQYFKKEIDGAKILVRVNPIHWSGSEISVTPAGGVGFRELQFDNEIFADLQIDGFVASSALEFNLYLNGLA